MTVVVCFNVGLTGAVMVADSRLSYPGGRVRDVCQKIFPPTDWSLLGFAGDLCLGNDLARSFFERLKVTDWAPSTWLDDDEEVRAFVTSVVKQHTKAAPGHEGCVTAGAGLILAWVSRIAFNRADGTLERYEPGTLAMAVASDGSIERQSMKPLVIGTGGIIKPKLTMERALSVANAPDDTQQMLAALNWTKLLIDDEKLTSVGGLFQVAHLGRAGGNKLLAYFYWADVTRRFGTYVAMRIKDGRWFQEHRPSGKSVVVRRPEEILEEDGAWSVGKNEMFEPRSFLTNTSKGVERAASPFQLLYTTYDPASVPDPVLKNWGPEPLEPQTFDPAWSGEPSAVAQEEQESQAAE